MPSAAPICPSQATFNIKWPERERFPKFGHANFSGNIVQVCSYTPVFGKEVPCAHPLRMKLAPWVRNECCILLSLITPVCEMTAHEVPPSLRGVKISDAIKSRLVRKPVVSDTFGTIRAGLEPVAAQISRGFLNSLVDRLLSNDLHCEPALPQHSSETGLAVILPGAIVSTLTWPGFRNAGPALRPLPGGLQSSRADAWKVCIAPCWGVPCRPLLAQALFGGNWQ